jgi:hypothetical protein
VVPLVIVVALVTVGPALLLGVLRMGLARDGSDALRQLPLLGRVLAVGLVQAVMLAVPAVALSSLSPRRGLVQGGYAAFYLLPWILGGITAKLVRSAWPAVLSLPAQVESVAVLVFQRKVEANDLVLPWLPTVIVMAAIVVGAVALLRWRLNSIEVVSG